MRLLAPVVAVLLCAGLAACGSDPAPAGSGPAAGAGPYRVLVFTRTTGFRHASIPTGIAAVRALGAADGFAVTATEDPAAFTPSGLAGYRAVVFLSTTGDVLDPAGRSALEAYVRGGGGFVGVHSASDTEYGWPFYGELVGARFAGHPAVQPVTVRLRPGPLTAGLPATWRVTDEPYNFRTRPQGVRVLATLDESTYSGGTMGADHPIAWTAEVGRGRSFYTGLGHPDAIYADPVFRTLLAAGIRYAAG
ncbi:MAG TPA: ThuA domain-containing protein [Mycobacteriales bacterium]